LKQQLFDIQQKSIQINQIYSSQVADIQKLKTVIESQRDKIEEIKRQKESDEKKLLKKIDIINQEKEEINQEVKKIEE
jgi:predicted metal-binding protein